MFQDVGGASMFLRWQSDTVKKQIVPESAFTPPADFEVYPVALSVAQNGKRLQATFKDRVGNHGKVKDHLKIEVDTSPMPVKAVRRASDNPRALVFDLAAPVLKGQRVKVVYDGKGGLTSGAETVPEIGRTAKNLGTEGIDLSVGSTMALAAALLPLYLGYGLVPGLVVALLAGAVVGAVNGSLVSLVGLQPIVATLALFVGGRGLALVHPRAGVHGHHRPAHRRQPHPPRLPQPRRRRHPRPHPPGRRRPLPPRRPRLHPRGPPSPRHRHPLRPHHPEPAG